MARAELEEEFRSSDGERVRDALLSAFYSEKAEWVQSWCLELCTHHDPIARYGVAVVLGNNAVVHRDEIDLVKCLEAVEKLGGDLEE
jgi:hypothetical protein